MSELLAPASMFGELSIAHRQIRDLLEELGRVDGDLVEVAERLCCAVAKHRASCTELVLHRAARHGPDHEQQARLLMLATHGIEQLVDRLRLPARDPQLLGNLVQALRTLIYEHERLELELTRADIPTMLSAHTAST